MSAQAASELSSRLEDMEFYKNTLYQRVQECPISITPGTEMMRFLRRELIRAEESDESEEYQLVVGDMFKVVTDSLISAVHRSAPYAHIDSSLPRDYHVTKDEDELLMADGIFDSDEEGDADSESVTKPSVKEKEQKQRKRDELRKRREEEEEMLVKKNKVPDDKGGLLNTLGPYAAPRLTIRASTFTFPSRKTLEQRTALPSPESSSEEEDNKYEEETVGVVSSSCSSGGGEAVAHLTAFMKPLSMDSLKKLSESAKVKRKPSSSNREYITQIVRAAVRFGCDKACRLMDSHEILEEMTNHFQAGPLNTAASIDFLQSLPDQLKHALGHILGVWEESPQVEVMWERMVAMGFLGVLTNLRLRPLKKIATELGVPMPDTQSTEKCCETIMFAAFPRERLRAKNSRSKKQKTLNFTVPPAGMRCKGHMGFITFQVENVSILPKDNERRYSPEFEFGKLKWSLLCMANKEFLALYLCQTGSVFCKFLITVVNHMHVDDSICNEGTQRFSTRSQENDWGFNTVIKFEELLNPKKGFWQEEGDSVTIEVGIVLVETPKPLNRAKSTSNKDKQTGPKVDEKAVRQLIEDEKMAQVRKRIKQEIAKVLKDGEKARKGIAQRAAKGFHDLVERFKAEKQRIIKELAERERREQQERQRELEIIKQAQEQNAEMKRRIETLKKESANLLREKKELTQETRELKKTSEKYAQELHAINEKKMMLQQKVTQQEKKIDEAEKRLRDLRQDESLNLSSDDDEANVSDDSEIMSRLRESLEQFIGTDAKGA
ncbi:trichohyalin [Trypanosoma rangeli]|uniref:Trichohyalin n=1 Tax=Trypanosoma rangeli TaxID=5698 RepID=A0A3R7ME83_TRYRA|nr:trichohyalin [Trypanosoma rangeli]RNF00922.1 trichohyalin [Trypanosoma rangeli]|eukprot:RNF00922.1 trichohyalin [Trypanosoma rangeli]